MIHKMRERIHCDRSCRLMRLEDTSWSYYDTRVLRTTHFRPRTAICQYICHACLRCVSRHCFCYFPNPPVHNWLDLRSSSRSEEFTPFYAAASSNADFSTRTRFSERHHHLLVTWVEKNKDKETTHTIRTQPYWDGSCISCVRRSRRGAADNYCRTSSRLLSTRCFELTKQEIFWFFFLKLTFQNLIIIVIPTSSDPLWYEDDMTARLISNFYSRDFSVASTVTLLRLLSLLNSGEGYVSRKMEDISVLCKCLGRRLIWQWNLTFDWLRITKKIVPMKRKWRVRVSTEKTNWDSDRTQLWYDWTPTRARDYLVRISHSSWYDLDNVQFTSAGWPFRWMECMSWGVVVYRKQGEKTIVSIW